MGILRMIFGNYVGKMWIFPIYFPHTLLSCTKNGAPEIEFTVSGIMQVFYTPQNAPFPLQN